MTEISSKKENTLPENWKDKNVLIVDDIAINCDLIKILLFKMKIKSIIAVSNGHEAVEICRTNPNIDLVLMDIRMPVMDGLEATKKIKEINKNMPVVIAQTAYAMADEREKIIAAGCNDCITKPIFFEQLKEVLLKYL